MCVYTRSAAAGGRTYASALCVYVLLSSLYKYGDYKSAKKELSLYLCPVYFWWGVEHGGLRPRTRFNFFLFLPSHLLPSRLNVGIIWTV